MRFLNPKTDFAFKKIFGSEQSREVLLSFLNAILGLQPPFLLEDVQAIDPYLAPKIKGMKDTYLDVRATDERGKQFIIEIQVLNVAAFEKRILYNACKAHAGQISRGDAYRRLQEVIAITITDFVMFPELPGVVNAFQLRAEAGHIYSDDLVLHFAELPKFDRQEGELVTTLERWFYFLKHAGDLNAVPETLQQEPAIAQAFAMANKAALTPEELEDQERREMFIQDQRGALELAKEQAEERGEERGEKRGEERGRAQERLRIARAMLPLVADDGVVARSTGLCEEEVAQLRGESPEEL